MRQSIMRASPILAGLLMVTVASGFSLEQSLHGPRASIIAYRPGVVSGRALSSQLHSRRLPPLRNSHEPSQPLKPSSLAKEKRSLYTSLASRAVSLTAAVALSSAAISVLAPLAANAINLSTALGGASAPAWLSGLSETGFYQAFSLVFLSEIGDKTFFIAGLLSAKTSRLISFVGSMGALAAMTLVSVAIGQVFHAVPEGFANGFPLDDAAACLAFLFFGIKTLKEAFDMEPGESAMDEEFADAQEAVEGSESVKQVTPWGQLASIFALVFAAEFGDRSFLSTIALSAAQNPVAVAGGAIAAHGVATGIAVSGGAVLAKYLSERVLGFIGGTLFIVFAVTTGLGIF